jgi:cytochrome c-type biogenesis protein
MAVDIGMIPAFGAGVLSFMSPCILPLVPPYLCFLAGASLDDLETRSDVTPRAALRAGLFVLGFSSVFVALGASASWVGQVVSDHLAALSRLAGVMIIALGLHMIGVFRLLPLMREVRFRAATKPAGIIGAFVVGLAFGFGWTPCVGPVLASILLVAGTAEDTTTGVGLLAAYAAGIGLPFIAASLFTAQFLRLMERMRRWLGLIETLMGAGLVATGVVVFLGLMPAIGAWLLDAVPALGRIG